MVTSITNLNTTTASLNTSVSSLNTFTASQSTASLVTSISNLNTTTSSLNISVNALNTATSSYETKGRGIWSGSAQLPSGIVSGSSQTIANLPTGTVSGSSQVLGGSGVWSGSAQLPTGVVSGSAQTILNLPTGTISGSSQLTSSYDGRYIQTGSFNTYTSSFSSSLATSITSVSGTFTNLTVNGQPTTYGVVNSSYLLAQNNAEQTGVGNGTAISFQTTSASNGSLITKGSNTQVTLTAGNTYKLEAIIRRFTSTSTWGSFRWYDVTNSTYVGIEAFGEVVTSGGAIASTGVATYYVTPSVNTTYELRQTTANTITVSSAYASIEITQINPTIAVQATATGTTSTNFIKYTRTASQTSLSNGSVVVCNVLEASSGNVISPNTSTGQITLTAGKTYRLKGMVPGFTTSGGNTRPQFCWYNETTSAYIGSSAQTYTPNDAAGYGAFGGAAEAVIKVNATTIVSFRLQSGASGLVGLGGNTDFATAGSYPWIDIEEIGSTFALNALDTMQISGSLTTTGSITSLGGITGSIAATNGVISGSSQLTTAFPSKTTGAWSVPAGASTQSFTVESGHSYSMWVNGNIPNGIITWNATVTTSNTNVPAAGSQYGWYYTPGNALVLTTIPDQIIGTNGSIANIPTSYAPNTSNVFKFGITNNSGTTQTINYGYIKLS